ncbi:protein-disulfide reductase DsbD family protein [Vibrio sp.]|nr:protein-disulfide reductase DsbD family protein [Vibrio sp.]
MNYHRRLSYGLLGFFLLCSILFNPAFAQSSGWVTEPNHPPVKVRFTATGGYDVKNKTVEVLLEVNLDEGWKTYWRSPGEGGIAPKLTWNDSDNINNMTWSWPMPAYYDQLGLATLGYKKKVNFPLTLHVDDMTRPLYFGGTLALPSCTTICVITDYPVSLFFHPTNVQPNSDAAFLYSQGVSFTPKVNQQFSIDGTYWNKEAQTLTLQLSQARDWVKPTVLIDGKDVENDMFSEPEISLSERTLYAVYKVKNWAGNVELNKKHITVTVSDDVILSEANTTVSNTTPINVTQQGTNSLLTIIGFALIGGLILNIMPCVLPVLGMKLNSLIALNTSESLNTSNPLNSLSQHSATKKQSTRSIRTSFLASSLGIIFSFLLIAAGLSVLKYTGQSVGWGIQFQSLGFILLMVVITLIFAMNLIGLFEIQLPTSLNTWAATKGDNSHLGHFIQGAFATLLATPCSAPFLGTAVAYALGASYFEMWGIFFALGVGMSLPWLTFMVFPSLIRFMPKPGPWMNNIKYLFGIMMLITSVWLITLLQSFIDTQWVYAIIATLLIVTLILISKKHGKKPAIIVCSIAVITSGMGLIIGSVTADKWATPIVNDIEWQPLDADKIPSLVQQGKTVFVDVTADWCITCKANKIGVLLQDPVYSALKDDNIVTMKGDWTRPSDAITHYLQQHNRFGVPFNIVYSPKHPNGIELPVILSSDDVMNAIEP